MTPAGSPRQARDRLKAGALVIGRERADTRCRQSVDAKYSRDSLLSQSEQSQDTAHPFDHASEQSWCSWEGQAAWLGAGDHRSDLLGRAVVGGDPGRYPTPSFGQGSLLPAVLSFKIGDRVLNPL